MLGRLVDEARRAIKKATAEPAWGNRWRLADLVWSLDRRFPEIYQSSASGSRSRRGTSAGSSRRPGARSEGHVRAGMVEPLERGGTHPDYSPIRHRFERLLELGHADEVVSLGREFLRRGPASRSRAPTTRARRRRRSPSASAVVFQAVMQSSLTGPERLLLAIDAELADDYDAIGEATAVVFDASQARGLVGGRRHPGRAVEGGRPGRPGSGIASPETTQRDGLTAGSPRP